MHLSRFPFARLIAALSPVAIALLLSAPLAQAGPVPGVETFTKFPVEFPYPKHLDVWEVGQDDYLVTFKWTPGRPVENPAVAGSFNDWSRIDLPLSDDDGDGTYEVTARLTGGTHNYKFTAGQNEWLSDPRNPEQSSDNGNSVLKLGIDAIIGSLRPERGDGQIESRGFAHRPEESTYFDPWSPTDAIVRLRTLKNDIEGTTLTISAAGNTTEYAMQPAGQDAIYEFYEAHVHLPEAPADGTARTYAFIAHDGDATTRTQQSWPLDFAGHDRFTTPDWAKNAVWYQLMVDRFRDGDPANNPEFLTSSTTQRVDHTHPWNADWYTEQPYERENGQTFWRWSMYERLYGGDFAGVIDKLDYLKDLGVTAIYMNPVFESSNAHKYNARSYVFADDGYGVPGEFDKAVARIDFADPSTWYFNESDKKLLELIDEAHKRGIKVVFDGVFNHLGDQAPMILDLKQKKQQSKFADWFDVISWDPVKVSTWGDPSFDLPQFKKDPEKGFANDEVTSHIMAITRRWMDPNDDGDPSDGIDGWRLDVPMDVPMPFWVKWRKEVKRINPDAYITGEVWDPAETWLDGTKFDAVMNYQFAEIVFRWAGNKNNKTTASQFDEELARLRTRYPREANYALMNLFDSHDTDRWVSRLANPDMQYDEGNRVQNDDGKNYMDERPSEADYARQRMMAVLQATYVGAPMIWYGTEVGMFGADDPMSRMPMWWEDLGPYENPEYRILSDQRDLFRKLFHLRNRNEALRIGDYRTLLADDAKDVFAFVRWVPGQTNEPAFVIALNNSSTAQTVEIAAPERDVLPHGFAGAEAVHAPGASEIVAPAGETLTLRLAPLSGTIIRLAATGDGPTQTAVGRE